jgi:hypothetical protein
MKRREFIAGSTSLLTYAISSRAMAGKQWRIGEVFGGNPGQIFGRLLFWRPLRSSMSVHGALQP